MEENYCQRMKHFVLRDHICSHLVLSKPRSTMLLCRGACRTVVLLPESGSLELLSGNQHSRRQRGSGAWASTQCLIHLTPKAASASGAEHRQPETPWVCHFCRGLSHIFQKHTRAALSLGTVWQTLLVMHRERELLWKQNIAQQHSSAVVLIGCQLCIINIVFG